MIAVRSLLTFAGSPQKGDQYTPEQMLVMKTQDIGYLTLKKTQEAKVRDASPFLWLVLRCFACDPSVLAHTYTRSLSCPHAHAHVHSCVHVRYVSGLSQRFVGIHFFPFIHLLN